MSRRRLPLLRILYALYFLVVAFIVFVPSSAVPTDSVDFLSRGLDKLGAPDWMQGPPVEFVTNVLMVIPLSLIGSAFRPRWSIGRWTLIGLAISCFIELTQMVLLPQRSAQVPDLVSNTLGALLGAVLARWLGPRLRV